MSSRKFTKEEMGILKSNKYTHKISPNTIYFTIQFKKDFWKHIQQGMDVATIVTELGYDPEMLGSTRLGGLKQIIKKQAMEGNFREGQVTSMQKHHPNYSELSGDQKLHAIENELYYLRKEMEFIKKISKMDKYGK